MWSSSDLQLFILWHRFKPLVPNYRVLLRLIICRHRLFLIKLSIGFLFWWMMVKEEIYREPFRRKRDDTSVTEIKINNHTLDLVRVDIITMMGILRIGESLLLHCSVSTFLDLLKFSLRPHPPWIHWMKHFQFHYLLCSVVLITYINEARKCWKYF